MKLSKVNTCQNFLILKLSFNIGSEINKDFLKNLGLLTNDEPIGDTSILPMYYLTKFTKNHVTVSAFRDGADELFIGYETYLANKRKQITSFLP